MPRRMPAGLMEALNRPDGQIETHSTLELFLITGAETRSFYFATASLSFNGVIWQPQLRKTPEISSSLLGEVDEAVCELQNVDTVLGSEFANLERQLSGAEAKVGRYWKDLERGAEWHKVLLTGFVEEPGDDELTAKLTIISDVYSDVSVGPLRRVRRLCQWRPFKGFECGHTGPESVCDYTLNGTGGCHGRHGDPLKFARHGGGPFLDNEVLQKIN